ncbi:PREDICTED: uncharacterized protein LOC105557971 isoform X2 [Vollenhovia emeryi]|uniref:uncharacterized protein LOC105557971 isoform X2 n=1 Tax=Vollenhovia emeryi TaxID=411798 RepID=UPI0005F4389C|nr:PREDICTED: uncharacterized protein LOC105557971 isoform X2 [Vollenhovia emeryi]
MRKNGGISTSDFFPIEIPSTSSSKRLLTDIDTIDTNAINNAKRLQKSTIDEVDVPTDDSKILASDNIKGPRRNLDETSKKFETIIRKQDRTINILRQRIRQLRNSIQLLNKQRPQILLAPKFLQKVFNKDQIEYLKAKYEGRHIYKWTGETIKKALRLKHACGDNGYKELLRQCFPLPAIRTLRNRLECISFKDGICDEVFDLLKEKVSNFPDERHSDCMICVDEMSLTPGE